MGCCCSSNVKIESTNVSLSVADIDRLFAKIGILTPIVYFDDFYSPINFASMRAFAESQKINVEYNLSSHDCDDFAFIFLGRAREAFKKSNLAPLIGILSGDLRTEKNILKPHAEVFFVDENKRIILYDPRTKQFQPFGQYMQAWNIIV